MPEVDKVPGEFGLPDAPLDAVLTPRELQILHLIAEGKTSRQLAETLNLSVFTINNHRKHICRKLRLHSTAGLVAYAVKAAKT